MHSVAIRNTCLGLLLVFGTVTTINPLYQEKPSLPTFTFTLKVYVILSAWLLICVFVISENPKQAFSEFRGEWVTASLGLIAAHSLGKIAAEKNNNRLFSKEQILVATVAGLALPGVWKIATALHEIDSGKELILGDAPYLSRASLSFAVDMLHAIILSDISSRILIRRRLLPISHHTIALTWIAVIGLTYITATRYGTANVTILTIIFTGVMLIYYRQQISAKALTVSTLIAILLLAGFTKISYDSDARWEQFGDSIRAGLATKSYTAWLNKDIPLPLDSHGKTVDHSAYMRVAWAKEGALAIIDYPFGVGYSRNAFGHALKKKYGIGQGDSHNGLINLTLSTGIPGTLLWFTWLASIAAIGINSFQKQNNPAGLTLTFLLCSYVLRMLMDGNTRDHPFEQFMFLVGLFIALSTEKKQ